MFADGQISAGQAHRFEQIVMAVEYKSYFQPYVTDHNSELLFFLYITTIFSFREWMMFKTYTKERLS